jgi:hypothetical protein
LKKGKARISEESFGCLASDGANGKTGPFLSERIGWRIKNGATQSLVQINYFLLLFLFLFFTPSIIFHLSYLLKFKEREG